MNRANKTLTAFFAAICSLGAGASAQIRITEWMYNGGGPGNIGEYVEFTNIGSSPIDMTGWSFDDNSRSPGSQSLSAFGLVQPGESVILTDLNAATFRTQWSLPTTVKIIGGNTNNLGRADEINLYDATATLVDRLTYDDQSIPGCVRTLLRAAGPETLGALGINDASQWDFIDTGAGDPYHVGYWTSTAASPETGNPGLFMPEPTSLGVFAAAGLLAAARRRR